jgi:hypothetical protein
MSEKPQTVLLQNFLVVWLPVSPLSDWDISNHTFASILAAAQCPIDMALDLDQTCSFPHCASIPKPQLSTYLGHQGLANSLPEADAQ